MISDHMVLLGSIPRRELVDVITRHIGQERRLNTAARWALETLEKYVLVFILLKFVIHFFVIQQKCRKCNTIHISS